MPGSTRITVQKELPIVATCKRFGLFVSYSVSTDAVSKSTSGPTVNALSVLMAANQQLPLPEYRGSEQYRSCGMLRGDWALRNDLINVLRENSLGWKFGEERTSGSAFVDALATVLGVVHVLLLIAESACQVFSRSCWRRVMCTRIHRHTSTSCHL